MNNEQEIEADYDEFRDPEHGDARKGKRRRSAHKKSRKKGKSSENGTKNEFYVESKR